VGRLASRIRELLHSRKHKRSACSIKHSHAQQASGEVPARLQGSSRRMVLKRPMAFCDYSSSPAGATPYSQRESKGKTTARTHANISYRESWRSQFLFLVVNLTWGCWFLFFMCFSLSPLQDQGRLNCWYGEAYSVCLLESINA